MIMMTMMMDRKSSVNPTGGKPIELIGHFTIDVNEQ